MSTKDWLEKDYYKVLGVPKDAKPDEIKKAYRKLARKHHPDANKGDTASESRFKDISEAYDVLSDEKRRAEYDEARALFGSGGFRMPGGAGSGTPGPGGTYTFDFGDLFGAGAGAGTGTGTGSGTGTFGGTRVGGDFGDLFGGLFGGAGTPRTRQQPRRGSDVETEVTISFTEAVAGATVPLRLRSDRACPACSGTGGRNGALPTPCPSCGGTGHVSRNAGGFAFAEPCRTCRGRGLVVEDPCPQCNGSGKAMGTTVITARIPAGVRDGQRIRLKGKGAIGERGGPNGDLYVVVHVAAHPVFGRAEDNLTVTVPVTFAEAALGADIKVPVLGGPPVTLKLPAGTANGRTFRVKGKGATRKDGSRGDLLVTVEVSVPRKVDGKAREALEAFRTATASDDPRAGLIDLARKE